jgi:hypothetical protein
MQDLTMQEGQSRWRIKAEVLIIGSQVYLLVLLDRS